MRTAGATFLGFVALGVTPLIAYILPLPQGIRFGVAAVLTLVILFVIGAGRALAAERIEWLRGGTEMLITGAVAATVAFVVGILISNLTGGVV
jgi:VIT1/CCC1 family predicted Fe2+/Mn2+ transporter